jgi:hypothetical protein
MGMTEEKAPATADGRREGDDGIRGGGNSDGQREGDNRWEGDDGAPTNFGSMTAYFTKSTNF